jgi:hypothetical protein
MRAAEFLEPQNQAHRKYATPREMKRAVNGVHVAADPE